MNRHHFCACLLFVVFSAITAFAAEPKLTLYVPFDGTIDAKIAGGNPKSTFGIKDQQADFASGVSGKGFLTGGSNQQVSFDAKGNISPDQWTISFWAKGLPGAQWNGGDYLQGFWELTGDAGEIMWFYRYTSQSTPWLFARPKKGQGDAHWLSAPLVPESKWHFWAFTWRKGSGAYMYLDGRLVGQSPCQPPDPVNYILIGQTANPSVQNKIIDEFKIYDAAMDSGTIARHYWQEGNFALRPTLTVAPTRQKITIDGKINAAEWQNAAGFTGIIDQETWSMEEPQTSIKMTYDDENIYVAMHSDNTVEAKNDPDNAALHGYLKKDAVRHDDNVREDDNYFLKFMPDAISGKLYSFSTNGIDTIYDALTDSSGNDDITWQSKAQAKSTIGADGWSMEAAIPLKSLGIGQIKDGATWNVQMGRVWKLLRQRIDLWSPGSRMDDAESATKSPLGTVVFSSQTDAIVDLQQFNIEKDGRVSATVNLSNPGSAPHEINLTLKVGDDLLQTRKVLLQPNATQNVVLAGLPKMSDGPTVDVTVLCGAKVLFHQSAPFILEHVGHLDLWSYPSNQQIRLGWGVQSGSDPKALSLVAQFKDVNENVTQTATISHLPSLNDSTMIDVKSLAPGKYIVEVKVKEGENILQEQAISYEKEPLPSWLGNKLGISDTPPPPWTDVTVDKSTDSIGIWGRDYRYAGNLLPAQIINQDKPMLAAPMRLVVKTGDNSTSSDTAKADAQWTDTTAMRATSLRSQRVGEIGVKADSYTEFDGMSWIDLTLTPHTGKVLLNGLTIDIPLKAEWAELIKPYDDYRLQSTGLLPEKGWKGDATSMPWIGNGDGGFQFFEETTASWIGSKTIEIIPGNNGTVIYRVHLIDVPTTLDKPLQFSFGWMTSPVKPAPKLHRDWRLFSSGGITNDPTGTSPTAQYTQLAAKRNPNHQFYFPWWQGWWWLPGEYKGNPDNSGLTPVPADPPNAQMNAVRTYFGNTFYGAPYGRLTEMGTSNPWFEQFGDEWVPSTAKFTPDATLDSALRITKVSQASPSLRDFYAWGIDKLLKEGNVHALYFDVSRPSMDSNIYHGAGTVMPDGSIEPMRNILGTRKMFQRIYTLLKAKHPDGKVFYHMSGEIMLPVDSFCDALIDGENYTGLLDRKDNRGYEKVLSVDQFRTEYSAQNNFGPASVFLPEFERAKSITPDEWKSIGYQNADYLMGLIFLHNSNMWWAFMPYDHVAQVYTAMDSSGWNADWKFIPYWQQKYFSLPQGVYASLYQAPDGGKVLLVIMNTSGKDQDITLPMTLDKSTFKAARAVYPDQAIQELNGNTHALHIPDNSFRAILLEK